MINNPVEYYNNKIKSIKNYLNIIEKKANIYSILRLIIVVTDLILIYISFKKEDIELMIVSFLGGIIVFGVIAFIHNRIINQKNELLISLEYCENGIKRIDNSWREFKDCGEDLKKLNHNFSSDLDIFGYGSLFQWCNTTRTEFGRNSLAKMLRLEDMPNRYEINDKQEVIKELSQNREFCEKLYIAGFKKRNKKGNIYEVLDWLKGNKKIDITIKYIPYFFICATLIITFLLFIGSVSFSVLLLDLIINYLVIRLLTKNLSDVTSIFIKNKKEIIQYSKILNIIQDEEFKSNKLIEIQKAFKSKGVNCKVEMNKLKNIINWLGDSNSNAYYLIINVFFMSDIFILGNLEKWRKDNGHLVENWILSMGEIEALSSLSNIAFENNTWVYPKISGDKILKVEQVAHPLLGERAKCNDFSLGIDKRVALITGSNMSGKSTFLRTIGFNLILSYLGLPVRAKFFKCGIYNIYTCMRTQDNLEESISSFYAEILRIKLVIEATKRGETVFFLLDEIFKGTNSKDRHDGARILIEQLVNGGAIGLVSTHDLELCNLEEDKKWLVNYNFREYYEDNKIKFDYTLREGMSKTQNAKHLMKLAGIEF